MRSNRTLDAVIPDNIFPLTASFFEVSEDRDDYGGRMQNQTPINGMSNIPCLFTHGVRGSVRDFGLRKDEREYVWEKASILLSKKLDVPYGSIAHIVWPASEGPDDALGAPATKTEDWRVVGVEHRPQSRYTRIPLERMDGTVRS